MLNDLKEFKALQAHRQEMDSFHMRDAFARDPKRTHAFSLVCEGLRVDFSRHRITPKTLSLLLALARARGLESWRDRMFAGAAINNTENRAVLHTALRAPLDGAPLVAEGEDVRAFVHASLGKMRVFSDAVRSGSWRGHTGQRISRVINIGIGGSDLGPKMVCKALKNDNSSNIEVNFVSNIDPADLEEALQGANPETTLFLIASKTFTTQETMANAQAARSWLLAHLKDVQAVKHHFAALSANEKAAAAFGIDPDCVFPFRDWVGGRYSLWSSIGLSICLAGGFERFSALLDGAHAMDEHFRTAPLEENIPVILGMLGIWYRNFWEAGSYAVLPYSHDLALLPAWLQQLDMESNGKSVDRDGNRVTYDTGPVVFGQPGTNGQHAFFQMIHQGTTLIPCDFIAARETACADKARHAILLANMEAQAQALMQGRTLEEAEGAPHRVFEGNRPSTLFWLPELDPYSLGMLLALYEHRVFVQGVIWNINSFDQWGVELGKKMADDILAGSLSASAT